MKGAVNAAPARPIAANVVNASKPAATVAAVIVTVAAAIVVAAMAAVVTAAAVTVAVVIVVVATATVANSRCGFPTTYKGISAENGRLW